VIGFEVLLLVRLEVDDGIVVPLLVIDTWLPLGFPVVDEEWEVEILVVTLPVPVFEDDVNDVDEDSDDENPDDEDLDDENLDDDDPDDSLWLELEVLEEFIDGVDGNPLMEEEVLLKRLLEADIPVPMIDLEDELAV
jgi:hypothetical protein